MTDDKILRRRIGKVLRDLVSQRHWAKQAAERAGDDRGGQDRCWWTGRADGLHYAVTELSKAMNKKDGKEALR